MSNKQRITLNNNGVVVPSRMQPWTPGRARVKPAVKLSRLQQLIRTKRPKIAIVRGEGLGDVIMTTPTVHAIREMFGGNCELTYATNSTYLEGALVKYLTHNPDINHIIEREALDDRHYDLVVNLHCPAMQFEKPGAIPPNRIDIFASHAGVKLKDPIPRYYIQKEEIETGKELLRGVMPDEKVILVQPFASSPNRTSNQRRLKEAITDLYQQYKIKSAIITHNTDASSDTLWNNVPGSIQLHNIDIRGIAGVMVHCDLVLCPDSSILHMSGALGVPCVSLFGPTPPESRVNRYPNAVGIWEGKDIPMCPCWFESCGTGYLCWERITKDIIVDKCLEHLQNTSKVNIMQLLENVRPLEIETEII